MLPHIQNSKAGSNKYDPVHKSLYEVSFTVPESLKQRFGEDEGILTEHVLSVSGLDSLYKGVEAEQQKFMGTSRSYLKPTVGDTFAEVTVKFSLNLRDGMDNYIYRVFNAWKKLGYDMQTGERQLKKDYCADWLKIQISNRRGDVFHRIIMKDVMLSGGVVLSSDLDYTSDDAVEIEVKFRSDWWTEENYGDPTLES